MGVLQQGRRTDGDRCLDGVEEDEEVLYEVVGQLCLEEVLEDDLVGRIAQRDGPQVVVVHEAVEEVGTEHHRLGNLHGSIAKLVEFGMALDDIVQEGQATALTAQRTLTDAGEVGIAVELQSVEHGHHTDILHASVLYDGIEDNLTVGIHILQLVPRDLLQEL